MSAKLAIRVAMLATVSISACLTAVAAVAQEQASANSSTDTVDDNAIVVTGTRIRRSELDFPNPITAVTSKDIQQSGRTNLTDYLTKIPALNGSLNSNATAGSNPGYGDSGLNELDLRHLGTQRTLVLVDGRRHVASQEGTAAVDINAIPTDLVERVDVLTGGASAIYGADGVSGVVNFVLKHDFEGFSARGQTGISQRGDAGNRFLALTAGKNFGDNKGNFAVAYEYSKDARLPDDSRRYLRAPYAYSFAQNHGDPNDDPNIPDQVPYRDLRYADSSRRGAVDVNPFYDADGNFVSVPDFTGDGAVYKRGVLLQNSGGYTVGGSSTPVAGYQGDIQPRIKRNLINGVFSYKFDPAFEIFAEGKFVRTESFTRSQPTFDFYSFIGQDNPFIPKTIRDAIRSGDDGLAALGYSDDGVLVTRDNFDLGIQAESARRDTLRGVLGAKGDLNPHAHYEISYVYGQTKSRITEVGNRLEDRYFAALDAVIDPATGKPTCRINLPGESVISPDNFGSAPITFRPGECVPLDPFGENKSDPAAIAFVTTDSTLRSKITQQVASASMSGDFGELFELPGGPVGFAFGGEWRKETSRSDPGEDLLDGLTWAGSFTRQKGQFDVKEIYAELNAPVLKSKPFAELLSFGAAIRYSDYSTIGKTTTWKIDGVYAPVRDITFRATYSEAVRAPNIGELFGAESSTFEFITDPCDIQERNNGSQFREANCAAVLKNLGIDPASFNPSNDPQASVAIEGRTAGNRAIIEETAKTWTAGVVLKPSFLRGLTASFDWYNIRLTNAINTPAAQELAGLCVDQPTLANNYCGLITRDSGSGYITSFLVRPENVANFRTAGADLTINYRMGLGGLGKLDWRLVGGYIDELTFISSPGADPTDDLGQQFYPKYQAQFDLTYTLDGFSANYGLSWFSKTDRFTKQQTDGDPDTVAPKYLRYKEKWEHDIQVRYDLDDRFAIYGGINNFTDEKPDFASGSNYPYPVSAIGRYFYFGAEVKLDKLF